MIGTPRAFQKQKSADGVLGSSGGRFQIPVSPFPGSPRKNADGVLGSSGVGFRFRYPRSRVPQGNILRVVGRFFLGLPVNSQAGL
jgi:hypothetical protein